VLSIAADGPLGQFQLLVDSISIPYAHAVRDRPGLRLKRLAKVSPRIVGIAWHRDRYRIPAADAFVTLTWQAAEREQSAARLQLGS
jgi:hypothetical protein